MGVKKIFSNSQGCNIYAYSPDEILSLKANINMIIGERSNGKTFAILELILDDYLKNGYQGMLIRRWADDFKKGRAQQMTDAIVAEGLLNKTPWSGIDFRNNKWFLYKYDEDLNKKVYDDTPFMFAWSLTDTEHNKSTSYSNVHYCLFDEFLTRQSELPDEPSFFMNALSTLSRYTDKVVYFMCANTVNKTSQYFDSFNININNLNQGNIYEWKSDEGGILALEYVEHKEGSKKKSDKYTSLFKSNKSKMITMGEWEMNNYPRLPIELYPKDIKYTFYILFGTEFVKGEYISRGSNIKFIYFSKTNTSVDEDKDVIFSNILDYRMNWDQNIFNNEDFKFVTSILKRNKIYYDSDETGEIIRNYLQFCNSYSIIKR